MTTDVWILHELAADPTTGEVVETIVGVFNDLDSILANLRTHHPGHHFGADQPRQGATFRVPRSGEDHHPLLSRWIYDDWITPIQGIADVADPTRDLSFVARQFPVIAAAGKARP